MSYRVFKTAERSGPGSMKTEVFGKEDPIFMRSNKSIPWDMAFLNPRSSDIEMDHVHQPQVLSVEMDFLQGRPLSEKDGTVLNFPRLHSFKSDATFVHNMAVSTNEGLFPKCPEDEENRFRDMVIPGLRNFLDESQQFDHVSHFKKGRKSTIKFKEDPKDATRRMVYERINRLKNRKIMSQIDRKPKRRFLSVQTEETPEKVGKRRKKKISKDILCELEKRMIEQTPKTKSQILDLLDKIMEEKKGAIFSLETDPNCFYPDWIRNFYRRDMREIGKNITEGMDDWDFDREYESPKIQKEIEEKSDDECIEPTTSKYAKGDMIDLDGPTNQKDIFQDEKIDKNILELLEQFEKEMLELKDRNYVEEVRESKKMDKEDSEMEDFTLPTPDMKFRKFDLQYYLKRRQKRKETLARKARMKILAEQQLKDAGKTGLPKFILTDKNYPPNRDQDLWCMRRFDELLKKFDFPKETPKYTLYDKWRAKLLDRRFREGDSEKRIWICHSKYNKRE